MVDRTAGNPDNALRMTKQKIRQQFSEIVVCDEHQLELDRAALLLAAEEYPHMEIEHYLNQLDTFAEDAKARDDIHADPLSRIMWLNHLLLGELEFCGNTKNYYDVRNSFLNEVIDRRLGIPITLSVIYIEVARRIGLTLFGVGLPGHFLVKYSDQAQEIFVDPFHGGRILTVDHCREMIAEMYDGRIKFQPAFLRAVTKKQILARMLQNLKGIYSQAMDHHKTLGVIEQLLLITPNSPTEIRDRGIAGLATKRYVQARADLEEYLRRAPMAEDASEIKKQISQLRQRQAQLN